MSDGIGFGDLIRDCVFVARNNPVLTARMLIEPVWMDDDFNIYNHANTGWFLGGDGWGFVRLGVAFRWPNIRHVYYEDLSFPGESLVRAAIDREVARERRIRERFEAASETMLPELEWLRGEFGDWDRRVLRHGYYGLERAARVAVHRLDHCLGLLNGTLEVIGASPA